MNGPLAIGLALAAVMLPISACAHDGAPAAVPIVEFDPAVHAQLVRDARWQIIIHSGSGIPGTPGAGDYYRQPKRVLQSIVDTCGLGESVYSKATDGVSVLTIVNDALSDDQVACIRSAEDNGLYLSDRGGGQ